MDLFDFLHPDVLDRTFLGASVGQWLTALTYWIGLAAGFIALHRLVAWRFRAFAERTRNRFDNLAAALLRDTRAYFFIGLAFFLAVRLAGMEDAEGRADGVDVAGRIAFVLLLLQVVRWGNTLITHELRAYRERKIEEDPAAVTTMQAVSFLGRIGLWAVVLLLALDNFGIDVTALIAGLGVGGIAVALAVQNILGDLFASLSIVMDKPFVVGDFLVMGDHMGTVERIGLKTTRVRSLSGEQIIISNSDLLSSRIRNYKRMFERRVVFEIGVVYQTPAAQLEAIPGMIRAAVEAQEQTRFDRAHFKGFGASALTFETVYYVLAPDYALYMDIQQAINLDLFRRFEAEGIGFAYPTQTLHVESPVRAQVVQVEAGDNGARA